MPRRPKKTNKRAEDKMVAALDEKAAYQEFVKHVPKKLRSALLSGKSSKEIYELFSQDAAARAVLIALTEKDAGKALAAIKDIQDRTHGRPTEKRETTHKFDELPDEELDAIVSSELDSLKDSGGGKHAKKH